VGKRQFSHVRHCQIWQRIHTLPESFTSPRIAILALDYMEVSSTPRDAFREWIEMALVVQL
jgi:hypothetical protein